MNYTSIIITLYSLRNWYNYLVHKLISIKKARRKSSSFNIYKTLNYPNTSFILDPKSAGESTT